MTLYELDVIKDHLLPFFIKVALLKPQKGKPLKGYQRRMVKFGISFLHHTLVWL